MFTDLHFEKGALSKQYKGMVERIKTSVEDTSTNDLTTLEVDETNSLDIMSSVTYIISKMVGKDLPERVYKNLSADGKEQAFKYIMSIDDQAKKAYRQSNKTEEVDTQGMECLREITENKDMITIGVLANSMYSDKSTLSGLIAEAVTLSAININMYKNLMVSPFNLHASILYYWASKKGFLSDTLMDVIKTKYKICNRVKKEEGFIEFLNNSIESDKAKEVAYKYILEVCNRNTIHGFMSLMEDFIDATLDQVKKCNKQAVELFEMVKDMLYVKDTNYLLNHIAGNKVNERYCALLIHGIAYSNSSNDIIYAYIYKKYNLDNVKTSAIKKKFITNWCEALACMAHNTRSLHIHRVLQLISADNKKSLTEITNKNVSQANELVITKEKLVDIKKQFKENRKQLETAKLNLESCERKISKLEKDSLISISREEIDKLHTDIEQLQDKLTQQCYKEEEVTRTLNKRNKEIESLEDKLSKVESDYLELSEKYERERGLSNQIAVHRAFSEIPMESFVSAIASHKIMILGGDMMHTKLKEYGLDNIKYYKAGCKELTFEDVANTDLIVICTSFVDHSSTELVVRASKNHDIPLLKYNNKNSDMLIYSIFGAIYK